jgi:hypothetical protein
MRRLIPRQALLFVVGFVKSFAGNATMKTFIVACIVAAAIAIGGVVVLNHIQEPVAVAFTTSAVRI